MGGEWGVPTPGNLPVTGTFPGGGPGPFFPTTEQLNQMPTDSTRMGLSEIAAGIEVTAEQDERGVATVDDTGVALVDRLREAGEALPCTPEAAATVVETHAAGASVGDSARAAGVAPVTAAKALHRCGVVGVTPLAPTARAVLRDWLDGRLSRTAALALTGGDAAEFALAAYVETHPPDPDLVAAVEGVLAPAGNAAVEKRDALAETMSPAGDFL